jgi:manganese/zinc/iron transport system substrate-binding protein
MNPTLTKLSLAAASLVACFLPACSPSNGTQSGSERPLIVTTTTMVTDIVRSIAGDDADVKSLMGPGVDPHLFKPGQEDIQNLQKADVIFYSGLHLEGRMTEIMERLHGQGRKVYAISDALGESEIIKADNQPDPHIWGDASQWAKGARLVGEKLAAALPDKATAIRERASAAEKTLTDAHARLKDMAGTLPVQKRVLVTSHDAFRYFGRAYGFEVIGIQGISTVSEANLSDMAHISDIIKQRGVKAVFVESSVSHATIERISKDTGAKIGGELFSDALGQPGDIITIDGRKVDQGTTAGMLESNMHTIVEALK